MKELNEHTLIFNMRDIVDILDSIGTWLSRMILSEKFITPLELEKALLCNGSQEYHAGICQFFHE